jgi:F-type H+-transporting ATPase subunit b
MNLAKRIMGLGALLIGPALLAAGVAGAGEAAHGGIDPAKVTDLILRTVNFLVFAGILIKLVAKPAKNFFAKRSQDIAQSLEELEAQKAAAAQALAEAEAKLAQVAGERERIIQQYISEGELEKTKIVEKAQMVATRIKEMAVLSIEQETKKAAQDLKREIAELSTKLAEDLLKKEVTYADQLQLVEEYLKKVVEAH